MKAQTKTLAAATAALITVILLNGLPLYTSTATCQRTRHICHGVPLGRNCLGIEKEQTRIIDQEQCEKVEKIQKRCNQVGRKLCKVNKGIGTRWAKKAEFEGQTCRTWNQKYSLNLTKC